MKKTLWISLSAVFAVLTVGLSVAHTAILPSFEAQLRSFFKPKTSDTIETTDGNEDTEYFKSSFTGATLEEKIANQTAAEEALCTNLEGEGAVLLMNKEKTLPFASGSKFSLFSTSSVDPIYGGTGSGQVSANDAVNLRSAINSEFGAGSANVTLYRHYLQDLSDYRRVNARTTGGSIDEYRINEAPWDLVYDADVAESIPDFPNAIVTLARSGGEGNDLPITQCGDGEDGNYLVLNKNEKDMLSALKTLKSQGKIAKIVVLLNGSNTLQLDFLDKEEYGIDAAVWIGGVGTTGMRAVAELLSGKRNFSGRLSDTFLKNNLSSPSIPNFGLHAYTNSSAGTKEYDTAYVQYNENNDKSNKCNENYIVYQEGIYIGYRYYETRYADKVMGQGNTEGYDYSADVAYPFGYGDSYTTWGYSNLALSEEGDVFKVSARITNTGSVKGKHAAEIYVSSDYTDYDKQNGVEKSAIQLGGFTKTEEIAPGEYEDVVVTVKKRDIASYDYQKAKTYILDGNYYFTIGHNAHDANNNVLAKRGYGDKTDAAGNESLVVMWANPGVDSETCSTSEETGYKITNAFAHADLNLYEGTADQKITYLTRSNWNGTFPKEAVSLRITEKMWEDGLNFTAEAHAKNAQKMIDAHYADWKGLDLPTMGKDIVYQAIMFRNIDDINDPLWDELVSQASYSDMIRTLYKCFHITMELPAVGLPATLDENGPQGYTASLISGESSAHGMAYTSEDVMASTRNVKLLKQMGECIGEDCLAAKNAGLYGPGANIHRNPYCGRNFEYYSEDPILSIYMQQEEVKGIQSKGVYVFTKHFALNDQESGRYGLGTWANEQSIREIYVKAFEGTALGGGSGVMSSFNRMGVVWAGADYSLMTTVLRNEWGVKGAAVTDCSVFAGYMDHSLGVLAGQDIWDGSSDSGSLDGYGNDPVVTRCVQRAIKHLAYSISHSLAMNGISSTMKVISIEPWWYPLTRYLAIGFGVLTGVCIALTIVAIAKGKSKKEA